MSALVRVRQIPEPRHTRSSVDSQSYQTQIHKGFPGSLTYHRMQVVTCSATNMNWKRDRQMPNFYHGSAVWLKGPKAKCQRGHVITWLYKIYIRQVKLTHVLKWPGLLLPMGQVVLKLPEWWFHWSFRSPTFSRAHVDLSWNQPQWKAHNRISWLVHFYKSILLPAGNSFNDLQSEVFRVPVCHLSMSKTSTRQNAPKSSMIIYDWGVWYLPFSQYTFGISWCCLKMGYPKRMMAGTNQHFPH